MPNPTAKPRFSARALGMARPLVLGLALSALAMPPALMARDGEPHGGKDDPYEELANDGLEIKRSKNTGKGMPSILGPFPDTVGLEFLGQLTNEELGASRLVFTGASFLSDIWGWTSRDTGDEYAIVGTSSGVSFVRITDPTNPEFLGRKPWRLTAS